MLRARPVAGDPEVAQRFMELLEEFVWRPGLSDDDTREIRRTKARIERERIPPGEDPAFHLKLGRGSLSDVEWTVQLMQLDRGIRSPSTMGALDLLVDDGVLGRGRCRRARHRVPLLRGDQEPALPRRQRPRRRPATARVDAPAVAGPVARHPPSQLREDYRRVTRRARRVVERLFYGQQLP